MAAFHHEHVPVYHNDGKEDWCNTCKLTSEGTVPGYTLEYEIKRFISSESTANAKDPSSTPDFLLAEFSLSVLNDVKKLIQDRTEWQGKTPRQAAEYKIVREKRIAQAIRSALPEYGSEDHGTYTRQTEVLTLAVTKMLDDLENGGVK